VRRREFITLVGGAAAVGWPLAVNAQQGAKRPTIGFLGDSTPLAESERAAAFARRLHDLGWIEGRTIAIEYRWADGRSDRLAEIAAEFARLNVDIIVTGGTPAVMAAKQAAPVVPIVFAAVGDPVGVGFVASLARPGGNVTGLSALTADLAGKRLGLLREVVPGLSRLTIMANVGNPLVVAGVGRAAGVTRANQQRINTLALAARLRVMHASREFIEAAGLISYGPNFPDLYRRTADYVDKILRGAKPADLPVEQPTKFELVVNLTTAKALGIEVPPTLLARADEVIE
jgi:putative ABC transport system substrate-binding protein